MSRGPKGFSDEEKQVLKEKLCQECEQRWARFGYKKTSIGELTAAVGISAGAFYLLFSSKEEFFFETLLTVQNRLKQKILSIIKEEQGKSGFLKALIWHFKEYERAPFLYDFGSPDYLAFLNKLSKDKIAEMQVDGKAFFFEIVEQCGLDMKIDEEKVYAAVSTLLYTVELKKQTDFASEEIFELLLNSVIDHLFK
ncbi:TetR/AcrR family transcriptional regulator [Enterococcus sp. LJL51]|uniref:TetR/AcrR family transcriptional regulator n=1 Tax=Enterococcus sp. LJL51 TaxID=3416656 RepID=UPI003CF3CE07